MKQTDDFAAYDREVGARRADATREIYGLLSLGGIHRLRDSVQEPFAVGWSVADAELPIDMDLILTDADSDDLTQLAFALGFIHSKTRAGGLEWIDTVVPRLAGRPKAQAQILRASTELEQIWRRLAKLGKAVEDAYWGEFRPMGLGGDFALVSETAAQLLGHGRPAVAADLLAMYADRTEPKVDTSLVADVLEAVVELPETPQVSPYEIERLLEYLRTSDLDASRLALLEWRLLPGLGLTGTSPVLERHLASDPAFFVQILSMCFKRSDGSMGAEVRKEAAENAFHLLHQWRTVPGSSERGGVVDEAKLTQWLTDAYWLLAQADREEIGQHQIGHVFAHARGRPRRDMANIASPECD